ncbi:hypothetical protein Ciccas_010799, partial [Cichlidogyrus casuarinus]
DRLSPYENEQETLAQADVNRRASDGVDHRSAVVVQSLKNTDRVGGMLKLATHRTTEAEEVPENNLISTCIQSSPYHAFAYTSNSAVPNNSTITFTPSKKAASPPIKCPFMVTTTNAMNSNSSSIAKIANCSSPQVLRVNSGIDNKRSSVKRFSLAPVRPSDDATVGQHSSSTTKMNTSSNSSPRHYFQPITVSKSPSWVTRNSSTTTPSGEVTINSSPARNYPATIGPDVCDPIMLANVKRRHATVNKPTGMKPASSALEMGPVVIPHAGGIVREPSNSDLRVRQYSHLS